MSAQPTVLDPASIALIQSSHAAKVVAVADGQLRTTLTHAYTCEVDAVGGRIIAVVERSQAAPVLAAIDGGRIALVVCDIESLRSLQVKGDGARIVELSATQRRQLTEHCREFADFAASLRYDRAVIAAHMDCRADDAVGIEFILRRAFNQTPGPSAGQPLEQPA